MAVREWAISELGRRTVDGDAVTMEEIEAAVAAVDDRADQEEDESPAA